MVRNVDAPLDVVVNRLIERRFTPVTRQEAFQELEKEGLAVRVVIDRGGHLLVVLALNQDWDRAPGLDSMASCLGFETNEHLPNLKPTTLQEQRREGEEQAALLERVLDALPRNDASALRQIFECADEADWERTRLLRVRAKGPREPSVVIIPELEEPQKLSREEFIAAAKGLEEKIRQHSLNPRAQRTKGVVLDVIAGMREKVERNRLPPPGRRYAALSQIVVDKWQGLDQLGQEIVDLEASYRLLY